MKGNIRKRGDTALSELAKTYELVRDELADRLEDVASLVDDLDARALGNRAYASAAALREQIERRARRVRPAPRRRSMPWAWLLLGALSLGAAWFLYDARRRDMVRGRVTQLGARTSSAARGAGVSSAVDGVMGKVRGKTTILDEAKLRSDVETAIAASGEGGIPDGLQVAVEGRTVYLRGTVEAALADAAATRAQAVDGVAAVVNLTTPPQPASGSRPASRRAGSA